MGLLNKFIHRKSDSVPDTNKLVSTSIHDYIEGILLVLENLGVMNKYQIIQRIASNKYYDEKIIEKLNIHAPSNMDYLEKYYGKTKFGYGLVKINQIRERLNAIASEKEKLGLTNEDIINCLIDDVEPEIVQYSGIVIRFNESLHQTEDNAIDYDELANMIEYWKEYYKEQELGYPVSTQKKIEDMILELKSLPYGGYGEDEINIFRKASNEIIEDDNTNKKDSLFTLNRITNELFIPKKNRYMMDVENLKKKIQMIEESPYLSEVEKEQNKQKTIKDFNIMNGHKQGINGFIEELKQKLSKLEFGGYGEEVLDQFEKRAYTMVSDGERIMKPDEEIQRDIKKDYDRLVSVYQVRLQKLKEKINELDQTALLINEKEEKKAILLEEFHDEMGFPIDFKERLNSMILALKGLERGGYGELVIEEFKNKSLERLEKTSNRFEVCNAFKDIRELYSKLIKDYKEELRKISDASERVMHDRHLNEFEKQRALEEFEREFKFKMGYRMNFNKYIENRCKELSTLPGGGYGRDAVNEFCDIAQGIANGIDNDKEKYYRIRSQFNTFKKHYDTNLSIFKEWKRIQLRNVDDFKKDMLEKDLNVKIAYMLSLSPAALRDYYIEDDRKKKIEVDRHNYLAAYRYLARKEAKESNNESLFEKRLKELDAGKTYYTQEEIDEAIKELELLAISGDIINEDEKVISLVEYIDSTLFRQMMYIEANLFKDEIF